MNQRLFSTEKLLILIALVLFAVGCTSRAKLTNTTYFNQKKDSLLAMDAHFFEPTIQPGDKLTILVSALDPISVAPYNVGVSGSNIGGSTYIVEADGTIKFPQFGILNIKGYKRTQLIDTLTNKIEKFVSNPLVSVQFINYKVTVLGEVNRPGVLTFPEGKGTLIEALGSSGDLTSYAKRENILVIREKNDKREFGYVNLLSINVFNSPYYTLQQNDIVYVEPTKAKATSTDQTLLRNLSIITTILSVISTVFFLVINITK